MERCIPIVRDHSFGIGNTVFVGPGCCQVRIFVCLLRNDVVTMTISFVSLPFVLSLATRWNGTFCLRKSSSIFSVVRNLDAPLLTRLLAVFHGLTYIWNAPCDAYPWVIWSFESLAHRSFWYRFLFCAVSCISAKVHFVLKGCVI